MLFEDFIKIGEFAASGAFEETDRSLFTVKRWEYGDIMKTANYIHMKKSRFIRPALKARI